jgi:enterochelin esterase family protein
MNELRKTLIFSFLISVESLIPPGLDAVEPPPVRPPRPAPLVSPELGADGSVTFRIKAPNAKEVKVVGQFGASTALSKDNEGVWSVTVPGVPKGVHEYHFVVDGLSVLDGQNPHIKPQRAPSSSILHVPTSPPAPWDWQAVPHGVLHQHEYDSKALGGRRRVVVYTPPGQTEAPLPVLYLLHGYGDNEEGWSVHGKAHWILDALLAAKKIEPMIVVMPDAHAIAPGGGTFEAYAQGNTEAFCRELEQDVIPLVEGQYRVRKGAESRAFAGLSMGGHHALTVALRMHDRFAYIGAFSAAPPAVSLLNEPGAAASAVNQDLRLLWIACGKKDFLRQHNAYFLEQLERKAIRYEFVETEGDHSWPVWRQYLVDFAPRLFKKT